MTQQFNDFRNKTLRQIRLWAWAAAVLPLVGLAAIFFIWVFGTDTLFSNALIVGETTIFATAVIWWWWAIYVINKIVHQWDTTRQSVSEVLTELRAVKELAREVFSNRSDK